MRSWGSWTMCWRSLTRIHFKSLGAILKLHDRIFAKWKEHLAALPTVQSVAEAPMVLPAAPAVMAAPAGSTATQAVPRPAAPIPAGVQQTAAKLAAAAAPKTAPPKR